MSSGSTADADRTLDAYARFYETLTPESLARLGAFVTADVRFRDPFNDVVGEAAMRRIFAKMFAEIRAPRFQVLATAQAGELGFLKWRFTGGVRGLGREPLLLEGVSEVHLAPDGRVSAHIDHWDAAQQVYERVPGLGWLLRRLRSRLAI